MGGIPTIQLAIDALKGATETVKSLVKLHDTQKMQEKAIELQGQILDAQSLALDAYQTQTSLFNEVSELQNHLARMRSWETEKQRYELKSLGNQGVFAYALKADCQGSEPTHFICPDCYQKGEKSILQQVTRYPGRASIQLCQRCGWEVYISGGWYPDHGATKSASRRTR